MSDIGLTWDSQNGAADFSIEDNDLVTDNGLQTAVLLSLFTDRRAESGDILPDNETDRRGWWADAHPVIEGDRFGSRLWLLARSKESQTVLNRAKEYAQESLQWLVDDKVADKVVVSAEVPRTGVLGLVVQVYRPTVDPVTFRFNYAWESESLNVV